MGGGGGGRGGAWGDILHWLLNIYFCTQDIYMVIKMNEKKRDIIIQRKVMKGVL